MPGLLREQICKSCGNPFMTRHPEQACCSRACGQVQAYKHLVKVTVNCAHCGTEMKVMPDTNGKLKKFCNMACLRAASEPTSKTCEWCGVESSPIKWDKRWKRWVPNRNARTCSKRCHKLRFTGINSPMWKGGITAYHRSREWFVIAEKARKRDKHTCQRCGKKQSENGRKLDVHHKTPFNTVNNSKKANVMKNLVTLCRTCHRKEESSYGKERQMLLPIFYDHMIKRRERRAMKARM